jgi:putative sugar O-methyltransferase
MKRLLWLITFPTKYGFINLYYWFRNRKVFDIQPLREFTVAGSSITDSEKLPSYATLCGLASRDEDIFKKFRSAHVMVEALDHVSIHQGNEYIREILRSRPWSRSYSEVLTHIDKVGKPRRFRFPPYGTFSPTLLRYLKVYSDLVTFFGTLENLKIAEIGIGFGGQASVIGLLDKPFSYTFYDIPPVLELAQRFTKKLNVSGELLFMDGREPKSTIPDLVISNYAFSELNRELQNQYLEKVILRSPRGYMTCNNLSEKFLGGFLLAELIDMIPNSQILPETPNTSEGNAIIVWGIK